MNVTALLHRPLTADAHYMPGNKTVIRLRTARKDCSTCCLWIGDQAFRGDPVQMTCLNMELLGNDTWFDYYQVVFTSPYERLCYVFELQVDNEKQYFYKEMLWDTLPADRSDAYHLPYLNKWEALDMPDWAADAIVYNVFLDSFSEAPPAQKEHSLHGFPCKCKHGGTIQTLIKKLDYLSALGINCLYLNPIFGAGKPHKYDTIDYKVIDPCFGTEEELKELVSKCHGKGIRVILDGVFNHTGWHFFAFEDVKREGANSPYADWFYRLSFPVYCPDTWEEIPDYACFGYERHMPKLNTSNVHVQQYFQDVCRYWMETSGIDGWRLDVADEVSMDFWRAYRKTAKSINSKCLLVGEIWQDPSPWLDGSQFDSTMNYDFRKACRDFFAVSKIDAEEFNGAITRMLVRTPLPMSYGQMNLLDSHDVSRFYTLCKGDWQRFQLAILYQMTALGMPSVFYGDEQGMVGQTEDEYRAPMRWHGDQQIFHFYQKAIALRKNEAPLRRGTYHMLLAQGGLYVYCRVYKVEKITIALNVSNAECSLPISSYDLAVWQKGLTAEGLAPFGFAVWKEGDPCL